MSNRGASAIGLLGLLLFSSVLVLFPQSRQVFWAFILWSVFFGSIFVVLGVAASVVRVLIPMYFGYRPERDRGSSKVVSFDPSREKNGPAQELASPEDLGPEFLRIEDTLAHVKNTLAFHRLSENQRHQYDRTFAELEVLIEEVSTATKQEPVAS